MKKVNKLFSAFLILFSIQFSFAQDSLKLSHQEFMNIVKNYHPLAFKYQLQNRIAREEITSARGNFDPVIAGKLGEKNIIWKVKNSTAAKHREGYTSSELQFH